MGVANAGFWAVALVSVPALLVVAATVPAGPPPTVRPSARDELRVLAAPGLLLTLLLSALVQGSTFCAFSYLEPLATRVAGLGPGWVSALLALFGVGSFLGVTVAGRIADGRAATLITAGSLALAVGWGVLAATAEHGWAVAVLSLVQGAPAFGTGTALIGRVLRLAAEAPSLAGSFATAAFNVGGALGPWLGGLALDAGFGWRAPVGVSALLMILAPGVAGLLRARGGELRGLWGLWA